MAIAIRSGGSLTGSSTNGNNITINLPAGTATGDVVYVMATTNGTPAMTTTGYTQVTSAIFGSGNNETAIVFRKVMGATPDTQAVITGTGQPQDSMSAVLYVLTGVDTTTPEDAASPTAATGSSVNPNPPAITTVTRTAWVLAYAATDVVNTISSYPSTYSGGISINGNDNNDTTAAVAYKSIDPAGTEDPGTYTINATANWAGMTVAVRPSGFIQVGVTGVSSTGSIGTVTVFFGVQVSVTGVSGTGQVGTVQFKLGNKTDVTGVSATGSVGTVSVTQGQGISVSLTGVSATGQVGTVTVKQGYGVTPTGVQAQIIITGVTTSSDALNGWGLNAWDNGEWGDSGTGVVITPASFVAISELGVVEELTEFGTRVTGVSATGYVGTVEVWENEVVEVSGVSGTGQVGSVEVSFVKYVYVNGVSATGTIESASFIIYSNLLVSGVQGTAEVGSVEVVLPKVVTVSGVSCSTAVGHIIAYSGFAVFVTGVYCTATTDGCVVWISVNDGQNSSWIPVNDQEIPDWVEIPV